ncbi:hypothetical protein ACVK1X_004663 [Pseudomonas sp. PvR086]|nr:MULTISPECIES: hypothetical protein [Pseudomonas]ANI58807.1 hypothetical protein PGR6_12340 [Pseudomonas sp. GR 6-02]MBD9609073.1 hypothetical protein [Pseudomonas sp. PDM08]MDR7107959.1 hypothetical protein [Pseudomonas frederiksbergensis]UVM40001.1 hypothetical protein LOY28_06160 [Pseudomonas sp. B21-017]
MNSITVGARLAREEAIKTAKSFAGKPRSYIKGFFRDYREKPIKSDLHLY